MVIPVLGPGVGIGIDMHQEEMMQEPDMSVEVGIQRVVMFEALKEDFHLLEKPVLVSTHIRSTRVLWTDLRRQFG